MRLYKLTTHFYGKDLDKGAAMGYIVAENDEAVFDHINSQYKYGEWPETVEMDKEKIVAAKGDHESEYFGEFYDQKFGWEDLGEISEEDTALLKRLNIIA